MNLVYPLTVRVTGIKTIKEDRDSKETPGTVSKRLIGVGFPSSSGSKPATNGSQEGVGATSTSSASSIGGPTGPGVMAKPPFRQVKRRAAFVPIRVDLKAVPFDNWAALFKWEERWSTIWPNKKAPHATTKNQRCTEQNSPNPKRS